MGDNIGFWDQDKYSYTIRRSVDSIINELQVWGQYSPTSKADADDLARLYIERGFVKSGGTDIDTIEYFKAFWDPEGDYIKRKAARGEKLAVSYIKGNKALIKNHVEPFF